MARTNPDRCKKKRTHACIHLRKIVTAMSLFTASRFDKNHVKMVVKLTLQVDSISMQFKNEGIT